MKEKENLEKMLKERYNCEEKIRKGFCLRIRENEIKVYYNGVKAFELKNGKLSLNVNMFLPNSKNVFIHGQKSLNFENVPKLLLEDAEKVENYFAFQIGEVLTLPFSTKADLDKESLYKNVANDIRKRFSMIEVLSYDEKSIKFKLKNYNAISFTDLYAIKYMFVDFNSNYLDENGKSDFQSVKMNISCILKCAIDASGFEVVEEIMKKRIGIYTGCGKPLELNRTKLDSNQEKQVQQKLMELLNRSHEDIWLTSQEEDRKKLLFSKSAYPFEMEYTIYAGENHTLDDVKDDNDDENIEFMDTGRARDNIKGRIDNVFIDKEKLILAEIKYGAGVISGTNGIHKHLMDLYTCLKHNKKIKEEIIELANYRNENLNSKHEILEKFNTMEYYIICFYNPLYDDVHIVEPDYNEIAASLKGMLDEERRDFADYNTAYKKDVLKNRIMNFKDYFNEVSKSFGKSMEVSLSKEGVKEEIDHTVLLTADMIYSLKDNLLKRGKFICYDGIKEVLKRNHILDVSLQELFSKVNDISLDLKDAKMLGYINDNRKRLSVSAEKKCKEYLINTLFDIQSMAEDKSLLDLKTSDLLDVLNVSNPNQYDLEILNWNVEELMERLQKEFSCTVSIIMASSAMSENTIVGEMYNFNK